MRACVCVRVMSSVMCACVCCVTCLSPSSATYIYIYPMYPAYATTLCILTLIPFPLCVPATTNHRNPY